MEVVGRKGMPYDRYPECWDSGTAAPNLRSFGEDVVSIGLHRRALAKAYGACGRLGRFWDALSRLAAFLRTSLSQISAYATT